MRTFFLNSSSHLVSPQNRKWTPLVNTNVDKEDNYSKKDVTTLQLLAWNLWCDESNQSDHFQEDLADSTEDEVSGPDLKDNIPDLVMTQCIQFGKKRSDQPELLPSFTNRTQPAPMEDPIQLQGIETPFTPIRRAHQRKIQACLYCSHAGQFPIDCLDKSSQAPANMNNPTDQ